MINLKFIFKNKQVNLKYKFYVKYRKKLNFILISILGEKSFLFEYNKFFVDNIPFLHLWLFE